MAGVNLKKISGLPIFLAGNRIFFGVSMGTPQTEIKSYRRYKSFFKPTGLDKNKELYYIYRNSRLEKDDPVFRKNGLRYDITVILPGSVGGEPIRTIGHTHKLFKGGRPAEIYQVVSGSALFLLQDIKTNTIYRIPRRSGQKIVIPGNCAHLTINQSPNKPLVVADIFIDRKNTSDYGFFKKTHGPSWRPLRKNGKLFFKKNPQGNRSAKLLPMTKRVVLPEGIGQKSPLYSEFVKNPNKFSFLTQSKKYAKKISPQNLFF